MTQLITSAPASGAGSVTIAAPVTANTQTLTLPDTTGTLATTSDSITQTQLATALNAAGTAPLYTCRAWVNFNGQGTVAIRASGNVSSITDNGVGCYTVNFSTAMPDINYAKHASVSLNYLTDPVTVATDTSSTGAELAPTTSGFSIYVARVATGNPVFDPKYISASAFR